MSEQPGLEVEDFPQDAEHEALRERLAWAEAELALLREQVAREARGPDRLRTEALLSAAGVATFEGVIPERRLMADDRFLAMIGYTREELGEAAANYEALVHPDDRKRAAAAMRTHLAGETPFVEVEYRIRHRAGHDVWVLVRGVVVERDERGAPLRFCGTQLDVSERVSARMERERLETQLQQSQKLESLGVLAGGVAHDFNNLLCGILGNVDLAGLDLADEHPAQQSLEEIRAAAHKATELCRQMLAYAGRERLVVAEVDLSQLVKSMGKLLGASVSKKASLRMDLQTSLPRVRGDVSQLRQVLLNLVLNASEALGDEPGAITLRTGVEECQEDYLRAAYLKDDLPAGPYVFVEVSDTGVGMDADTQSRLFDPFFSTKFLGRGLGLASAIGILRAHGGTVRVYSEVGKGSVFKVYFPALVAGEKPTVVPPVTRWTGSGRVLLADDEPSVRSVGARMLQRLGFEVLLAEDGREAVRLFEKHGEELTLVLLDMTMPHLDGAETFRELRRLRPDIKVLLTSGYTEAEATGRFTGKGLAGFVQKPFRLNALRLAVQAALE